MSLREQENQELATRRKEIENEVLNNAGVKDLIEKFGARVKDIIIRGKE